MADDTDKQTPQQGFWVKWGNGYFYTNQKDVVLKHLDTATKTEKNTSLKSLTNNTFEEIKLHETKDFKINQIDTNISVKTANIYSNHCITDAYGDRYFDIPIYLIHHVNEKVNDYFQVEARKLSFKKRIRLIRLKSNTDNFDIEQILFQNKPTNFHIIPMIEKATECTEHTQLENLDGCILLSWKCIVCDVKSDHWVKLNKHNCKDDELSGSKLKKNVVSKNLALKNNSRSVAAVQSQHICPHCNGEFDSEGYLRTHLMVHVNDSNKCPFCDQPIAPDMMDTHLIAHQNPEFSNLKFLCKYDLNLL